MRMKGPESLEEQQRERGSAPRDNAREMPKAVRALSRMQHDIADSDLKLCLQFFHVHGREVELWI